MASPEHTLIERLVQHVRAIRYESLPPEAIELSKQIMLDGLAVMHAGSAEPLGVGRIATAYVREMGGQPRDFDARAQMSEGRMRRGSLS
jgi:hypothetical protein